jgi:deoxyadenosine/deoxycytidine kinase
VLYHVRMFRLLSGKLPNSLCATNMKWNLRSVAALTVTQMLVHGCSALASLGFTTQRAALTFSKPAVLTPVLVSIEGNIGAGKTTLLKKLRSSHPEWTFIDEPVDTWSEIKNEKGESMLEVFYKDRNRWSYTFQNCALLTRHQNIESTVTKARDAGKVGRQIFLTERCLDTDYHVFTKMLKEEGSIDKLELDLYIRWLNQLKAVATPLSAIVHVNTVPKVCAERIRKRSRGGEGAISLDYLENLSAHQSKWVGNTHIPVFPTDLSHVSSVVDFIEGLTKPDQVVPDKE